MRIPFLFLCLAVCAVSAAQPQKPVTRLSAYVNPFIGTGGHGHTYPGATLPFGMVQLSPDEGKIGWDWSSGYHYSDTVIAGFSHLHLSGTGIGDFGDILVTPTVTGGIWQEHYRSRFSHAKEATEPGYYSVELLDHGIRAELTATLRAGFHRYTFPRLPRADIVINLVHGLEDRPTDACLIMENPTTISGYRMSTGWAKNQKVFFVIRSSKPFVHFNAFLDGKSVPQQKAVRGARVTAILGFPTAAREKVLLKVGISSVSIEGARKNVDAEIPHWDFDRTRRNASQAWEKELGKFTITSTDESAKTVFYTALYHTMLAPVLFNDVDGSYRGADDTVHAGADFDNYHIFSLWDTFRAAHPLFTITEQQRVRAMVQSMLAFSREGGLLPVWSLSGNETNTMIGYHAIPVIADAYFKKIGGFEIAEAFAAMKKSSVQRHRGLEYYVPAQPAPLAATLNGLTTGILQPSPDFADALRDESITIIPGFGKVLAGERLAYHSSYPHVGNALLVRATDGTMRIHWESAPVPQGLSGRTAAFHWPAGMASFKGAHRFDLSVDGQRWFSFRSSKDDTQTSWKLRSDNGAELLFHASYKDQHGDLFGDMVLKVPGALCAAGKPLTIEVTGENGGSQDWYMAFEHSVQSQIRLTSEYVLVEENDTTYQLLRADIEHVGPTQEAVISAPGSRTMHTTLVPGCRTVYLPIVAVSAAKPLTVTVASTNQRMEQEIELRPIVPYEYIPADKERESVSKTLEYAYDDWCIAQVARAVGSEADYKVYMRRSEYYRNLFDPSVGFMRGRSMDGSWTTPFNPRFGTIKQPQYTEGNAWQYSWFVPHDVDGLIGLMGGKERFLNRLDSLFGQESNLEETGAPSDVTGLIGMYAHGNEPSHHVAYLYTVAGVPWKTQQLVRRILDSLYTPAPDGLCGNDDCGQMSAWYILSAMGFYPVNPCGGVYVLGTPRFERMSVSVGGVKKLTIVAREVSSKNIYVQSASWNGRELKDMRIRHEELVSGGTLTYMMGPSPRR